MRIIDPFYNTTDARGKQIGLFRKQIREVNWAETKKGIVRGGHYHKRTKECLIFISGKAKAWAVSLSGKFLFNRIMSPGDVLMIEPGEVHFVEALDDCLWFNALDKEIDAKSPDIHKPGVKDL